MKPASVNALLCTYFDHNYLPRGLALYELRLRRHAPDFELWVLCLSRQCHEWLAQRKLPASGRSRWRNSSAPTRARSAPSRIGPSWSTTSPARRSLPLFVFARAPEADLVTYLDSDLYFFRNPEPVFAEIEIALRCHYCPSVPARPEASGGDWRL